MRYANAAPGRRARRAGPPDAVDVAARPAVRPVDRVREAARDERYWVLKPEGDGTWTLRHLDDTTGLLSAPAHTSGSIGDAAAASWATGLVDVECWHGMSSHPGARIEEAYTVVREISRGRRAGRSIVVRIEDGAYNLDMPLVVVRERWDTTGLESDPLHGFEPKGFADDADMLRHVSRWFGLDPGGWQTITEGTEYHHP